LSPLVEKVEVLEGECQKVRKALEFLMELAEDMERRI
jgi:hypothetical protein